MSSSRGASVDRGNKDSNHSFRHPELVVNCNDKSWDHRIWRLSCAAFALGCVWILLFPLVTVTTGETKPRGTFFDENAMLVYHTTVELTAADVDWARPRQLSEAYPQVTINTYT